MGMPMPPSLIGSEKKSLSSSVMVCLPETAGMNWWRITSSNGFNWSLDRGTILMKNIHPDMTPCEKAEKAACGWDFANSATFPTCPSQQQCTGKPPTRTATLTSSPTISWTTNMLLSRLYTAGQEQSAQTSLSSTRRPSTSGRPSSTMVTQEEYFNTMRHRLN